MAREGCRRPIASHSQQAAIEDRHGVAHEAYMARRLAETKVRDPDFSRGVFEALDLRVIGLI